MQIKHFRSIPRDSITGWEISDNIYVHYPLSMGHWLSCFWTPWMCTIQVHCSSKLLVDWIYCGRGGGVSVPWVKGGGSLLHIIPHRPGLRRATACQLPLHSTLSTNAHLTYRIWLAVHPMWWIIGLRHPKQKRSKEWLKKHQGLHKPKKPQAPSHKKHV